MLQMVGQRVQACAAAGFDGVELDVVDAYAQGSAVTGWDISAATQLEYNQRLANLVHGYGLTVALKNDLGQLAELLPYFDYAINEQCFQYDECDNNPAPGYARLGRRRQGRLPGRVPALAAPLLRRRQRRRLQLDPQERQLPPLRQALEALPLSRRTDCEQRFRV